MHFRGCSGEPNRLARSYHSGDTGDLAYLVEALRQREPGAPIAIVGFSLGGNVLLKWLGQTGNHASVRAAVAVSPPFVLHDAVDRMQQGFSRLYQWYLLRSMRRAVAEKRDHVTFPIKVDDLAVLKNFRDFDERVTAPLHGFDGANHYYTVSSSRQYLKDIAIPTLILHARDDPFMSEAAIPGDDELSETVTLELSARGGHVGFIAGAWPWRPRYWLEQRIPAHLAQYLAPADYTPPLLK
jgi:predicted alpha/beta-fold hydrolase